MSEKRAIAFFLRFAVLLALVMAVMSLQPAAVYAELVQTSNGSKYINRELGFELTFSYDWTYYFEIQESSDRVKVLLKYDDVVYSYPDYDIPPLIEIYTAPNDGQEEGLRYVTKLGTKGDVAYYSYQEPYHIYVEGSESLPSLPEITLFHLLDQVNDVLASFKILDTEETQEANEETPPSETITIIEEVMPPGTDKEGIGDEELEINSEKINSEIGESQDKNSIMDVEKDLLQKLLIYFEPLFSHNELFVYLKWFLLDGIFNNGEEVKE